MLLPMLFPVASTEIDFSCPHTPYTCFIILPDHMISFSNSQINFISLDNYNRSKIPDLLLAACEYYYNFVMKNKRISICSVSKTKMPIKTN